MKALIKKCFPFFEIDQKILRYYKKSHKAWLNNRVKLSTYYCQKCFYKYGCYISPSSTIGKNLLLPHPIGVVIGAGVVIGDNVTIYQNVTLGARNKDKLEYPTIGNDCVIYANSVISGNVFLKDGTIVPACSFINPKTHSNNK